MSLATMLLSKNDKALAMNRSPPLWKSEFGKALWVQRGQWISHFTGRVNMQ